MIDYPSDREEEDIVRATTSVAQATVSQVVDAEQIIELQQLVRRVPVADHCVRYAVSLVRSSRPVDAQAPDYIREMVSWVPGRAPPSTWS